LFAELLRLALASWLALTTWLASAALPSLARAWSGATLLERLRTAGPLFAELLLLARQTLLAGSRLSRSRLSRSALRSCAALWSGSALTLLDLWRATGTLFAELLLLARQSWLALSRLSWSGLSWSALWSGATLTLLDLWRATGTLLAELLLLAGQTLLARSRLSWSALRSGAAALATLLELLCATGTLFAKLFLLAALLALTTLLAWRAGLAPWALLRLPLTALLPAGLTFVRLLALVFILGVFALRDDQAAVYSAGAVKRDAQLRNRNRRHQGAGEQDVAKLLQLPDRFEWQVALPGES
jgi:hypothetical protein